MWIGNVMLHVFHLAAHRHAPGVMKQLIATVCFAAILSFGVAMLEAQDANVITAAKREGRVVWYSVAGESQQLAQEFEKKYPFVKVEVVRSTVYPLLTRILNEARA